MRRRASRALLAGLTAALMAAGVAAPAHAQTGEEGGLGLPVRALTLDNGMSVLVVPREGASTVSFVMQFRVGGVDEPPGQTGIAHLLEHMLFKGTGTIGTTDVEAERRLIQEIDALHDSIVAAGETSEWAARLDSLEDEARRFVVPNEYSEILSRAGAQGLNAMTTSEATIYFVELPSARAELFFALEADRMADPVFREFHSERAVVMEERRMRVDASPGGTLYEQHLRTAFEHHPYGQPVVGTMEDLERLGRPEVEAYYRRFYGPANAVLAVVGDIDPDDVEEWATEYLGRLPPGDRPPPVSAVEPPQRGERRVDIPWDAEPLLRIGWHIPDGTHPDIAPLGILASVLTGGRTSRLHRRLVTEEGTATAAFASLGPGSLYPSLFQIDATPISPTTPADLERAIYEEVDRLAREGPTEDELQRIKNQVAASRVRRMQSNIGLAFQLAESASFFGDWRETFRVSERFLAVERDDVRRVAASYLTPENRTVATIGREGAR